MSGMSVGSGLRLAFWARNMVAISDGRMEWPGFSYTPDEWLRLRRLAEPISTAVYRRFVWVNAAVFILLAAVVMFAVFLPLASVLFPVPAETGALEFTLLLAAFCLLVIGIGLPLSMLIASRLCADAATRQGVRFEAVDDALAARISWQLTRITLIMCGLLVPGVLLFIAYDIDGGPIVTALKWLAIAAMTVSVAVGFLRRNRN